ncbi:MULTISPECIES: hypothetical protein [unclassified Streptomyces]|uniref:hypothetical protein n=1 Tax=Streptomyces TaxID=1883 RepID=UPI0011E6D9F2|nr:hypothetical protein [Streptomyces sp. sk2.1]
MAKDVEDVVAVVRTGLERREWHMEALETDPLSARPTVTANRCGHVVLEELGRRHARGSFDLSGLQARLGGVADCLAVESLPMRAFPQFGWPAIPPGNTVSRARSASSALVTKVSTEPDIG